MATATAALERTVTRRPARSLEQQGREAADAWVEAEAAVPRRFGRGRGIAYEAARAAETAFQGVVLALAMVGRSELAGRLVREARAEVTNRKGGRGC